MQDARCRDANHSQDVSRKTWDIVSASYAQALSRQQRRLNGDGALEALDGAHCKQRFPLSLPVFRVVLTVLVL